MLKLKIATRFKKELKKYQHRQAVINELGMVIHLLRAKKKLPQKNKDHALSGNYHGYRECHIKPDVLLVYKYDEAFFYLARIGSHSELF